MRTFNIYFLSNVQTCNTVLLTSHHAVCYYLFDSWKFVLFDPLHPFCTLSIPRLFLKQLVSDFRYVLISIMYHIIHALFANDDLHLYYLEAFYEARFMNALREIEKLTFLYLTQNRRENKWVLFVLPFSSHINHDGSSKIVKYKPMSLLRFLSECLDKSDNSSFLFPSHKV